MKVNVEKIETNRVRMDIEVNAEDFSAAVNRTYRKLAQRTNIPGFRKGKAPRHIFERFVGKEALYDETFESFFPSVYARAVDEAGIEPVDMPEVETPEFDEKNPFQISTTVTVKPEVQLGDYAKVSLAPLEVSVTDEDVDSHIEYLRERQAVLSPVEGPVENGHMVTLDFAGSIDGVAFPGGTASDHQIEVGSGSFIPGYEEQIVGMQKGETKPIEVTFPEDYHAEDLAGKAAVFSTTVKEIKKKELPEVDDGFAKSLGSVETLEQLRKDIKVRFLEDRERTAKRAYRNEIIRRVASESTVEIPQVMIDRQAATQLNEFVGQLGQMNLTLEAYASATGKDAEMIENEVRDGAEWRVKVDLVLEAIAKKENFEATQEETDASVSEIAERYKEDPETIRTMLLNQDGLQGLKEGIVWEKTVAFLEATAGENAASEADEKKESDAEAQTPEVSEPDSAEESAAEPDAQTQEG